MHSSEAPTPLINWHEYHFTVTNTGDLTVVLNTEEFGWVDMEAWEEAMLDGPLADIRRANDRMAANGLRDQIDTIKLMEGLILKARTIFLKPLVELNDYARYYQVHADDTALFE